jgi:hypothetical protein
MNNRRVTDFKTDPPKEKERRIMPKHMGILKLEQATVLEVRRKGPNEKAVGSVTVVLFS